MRLADVFTEKVVLYVDQFEEIFMPNISEDERQQFISLLVTAVNEMNGSLAAILTMRADFYDRPMNYRDLGELISKHQYSVLPMTLAELREAVENPAALSDVGLAFEPGLVGEIVFDLRDQKDKGVLAGALPLLQFTLKQLYELRDTSEAIHVLTFDAYRSMGGVNNAIGSHAETVFSQLDSDAQAALGRVFIHLVNVNERGEATRKRAPMAQWENDADAWELIHALVNARLLLSDREEDAAVLEVAHEALLRTWERLVQWINETAEDIRLLQKVTAAALDWEAKDKAKRLLWSHEDLLEVYQMHERLQIDFEPLLEEFTQPELDRILEEFISAPDYRQRGLADRFGEIGEAAVPYLIRGFEQTDDSDVERKIVEILWDYAVACREQVLTQLSSNDVEIRCSAAKVLRSIPMKSAFETGLLLLRDRDARTRGYVVEVLGWLADKRAFEPLVATLRDADKDVRRAAAGVLGQLGDERAVEPLVAALGDANKDVRYIAARVLGQLGDERAFEPLVATLRDADKDTREAAAGALGQLGDERVFEPLVAALGDADKDVRQAAASALGQLGDERAFEPLVAALGDADMFVGQAAAGALGQLGDERAVEPLVAALGGGDMFVRYSAARALGKLGDERAVEPLVAVLGATDMFVRSIAAGALGQLADKRAFEPLVAALGDADREVRQAAASALGQLGDERAFEPLVAALGDVEKDVRQAAAGALGKLGDGRAVEPLVAALGGTDRNVRSAAAEALGKLGDGRAGEPLVATLEDADKDVRYAAAGALGQLGDERAVEPLVSSVSYPNAAIREVCVSALCKLKAAQSVPLLVKLLDHPFLEAQQIAEQALECMDLPEAQTALETWRKQHNSLE